MKYIESGGLLNLTFIFKDFMRLKLKKGKNLMIDYATPNETLVSLYTKFNFV